MGTTKREIKCDTFSLSPECAISFGGKPGSIGLMEHHQLNNENRRGAFIYTTSPFYGGENMECHGPDTTTTSMMALMTQNQDQQPQLHQRLMAPLPIHLLRGHESQSPQSFHLSSQSLKAEPAGFDRVVRSEHYRAHPGEVVAPRVYAMMLQSHEVENGSNNNTNNDDNAIKAKIVAHPQYSSLLEAYMDCQRVGAPPEVVDRLSAISRELETRQHSSASVGAAGSDPELDQFMEAYYDMLVKYREELTRPIQEATEFLRRIESELNSISNGSVRLFSSELKKKNGYLWGLENCKYNALFPHLFPPFYGFSAHHTLASQKHVFSII
ncbi:hypothetical protein AMTRI_Chr12g236610 [Amborella trichopoda]